MLLQLDSAHLPPSAPRHWEGLLQFFYCRECDGDGVGDAWRPFSEVHLLRTIPAAAAHESTDRLPSNPLPQRWLVGWDALTDLPSPMELDLLGLEFKYHPKQQSTSLTCASIGLELSHISSYDQYGRELAETISPCAPNDKLLGWPNWVQGVEYPSCTKCDATMRHLFQIDSEQNVAHMFGDAGRGHITQCPNHPNILAFSWACS